MIIMVTPLNCGRWAVRINQVACKMNRINQRSIVLSIYSRNELIISHRVVSRGSRNHGTDDILNFEGLGFVSAVAVANERWGGNIVGTGIHGYGYVYRIEIGVS